MDKFIHHYNLFFCLFLVIPYDSTTYHKFVVSVPIISFDLNKINTFIFIFNQYLQC